MKLKNLLISVGAFALVSSFAVGLVTSHDEMTRTEAADSKILYLSPSTNWKVDNARFAAYFFGNGEKWLSMTDEDADGIYEVEAPTGYPSVIFCRMNPGAAANNWDNKWNQTSDLTVPTDENNMYTVKEGTWDKGGGAWSVFGGDAPEIVEEPVSWGISGSMNSWGLTKFTDEDADGTAEIVIDLAADDEFKLRVGEWLDELNATDVVPLYKDWFKAADGDNISVIKAGTYTFTAPTEKTVNILFSEVTIDLAIDDVTITLEGEDPIVPPEPEPVHTLVGGKPLYLDMFSDWTAAGAKFGFYYINGGVNTWSAHFLTKVEGAATTVYEDVVPEGEWTKVIAVRFNSGSTDSDMNWDSGKVWNQTGDITVINNMNVVKVTDWNKGEADTTFTSFSRAYCWANHFLATVECDGAGSNTVTGEIWSDLEAQYDAMHADAKTVLKETVGSETEGSNDIEKALLKYDYLVEKYADNALAGKAWMTDFIGRVEVTGANRLMTSLTNNNNMVMIIVISSVVAVLGVSVFFIYRRKRNVQ